MDFELKHLIYQIGIDQPSLVFVDNNPGYICYFPESIGYKSTSIIYNGIKEAGGLNFYSSKQSIGGGFFINGNLFSLTNVNLNEWFGLDVGRDVSSEIFFASMVSEFKVFVACIVNVDPSINKVIYTSKTIDTRSMLLAASTYFYPSGTTETEIVEHQAKFNDSLIGVDTDSTDKYYDDLIYNGAYGFSSLTTVVMEIDTDDKKGRTIVMNQVLKDITSLMEIDPTNFVDKDIYAGEVVRNKDGVMMLLGINKTSILVASKTMYTKKDFANDTIDIDLDNMSYGTVMSVPSSKKNAKKIPTYYPTGIFYHDIPNAKIILNRFEEKTISVDGADEVKTFGAEYVFDLKIIEGKIVISTRNDEEEKALPTSVLLADTESDANAHRHSILGQTWSLNVVPVSEGDILGRLYDTKHLYSEENMIPNQTYASSVVKSMAIARQYFSFT